MNPITLYIDNLPLKESEKWLCNIMATSGQDVMPMAWLVEHTSYEEDQIRLRLNRLRECGMVDKETRNGSVVWFISDPRLKQHIYASHYAMKEAS